MHDPKSLEAFFLEYMPKTKALFEGMWVTDRRELSEVLQEFMRSVGTASWMHEYFADLEYYTRTAQHKYTDPWSVL
jgi:hypothetical protein